MFLCTLSGLPDKISRKNISKAGYFFGKHFPRKFSKKTLLEHQLLNIKCFQYVMTGSISTGAMKHGRNVHPDMAWFFGLSLVLVLLDAGADFNHCFFYGDVWCNCIIRLTCAAHCNHNNNLILLLHASVEQTKTDCQVSTLNMNQYDTCCNCITRLTCAACCSHIKNQYFCFMPASNPPWPPVKCPQRTSIDISFEVRFWPVVWSMSA